MLLAMIRVRVRVSVSVRVRVRVRVSVRVRVRVRVRVTLYAVHWSSRGHQISALSESASLLRSVYSLSADTGPICSAPGA